MRNLKNQVRSLGKLQTRDDNTETDEMKIEGYFVVFNSETELFENFYEEISDKAFQFWDSCK